MTTRLLLRDKDAEMTLILTASWGNINLFNTVSSESDLKINYHKGKNDSKIFILEESLAKSQLLKEIQQDEENRSSQLQQTHTKDGEKKDHDREAKDFFNPQKFNFRNLRKELPKGPTPKQEHFRNFKRFEELEGRICQEKIEALEDKNHSQTREKGCKKDQDSQHSAFQMPKTQPSQELVWDSKEITNSIQGTLQSFNEKPSNKFKTSIVIGDPHFSLKFYPFAISVCLRGSIDSCYLSRIYDDCRTAKKIIYISVEQTCQQFQLL